MEMTLAISRLNNDQGKNLQVLLYCVTCVLRDQLIKLYNIYLLNPLQT